MLLVNAPRPSRRTSSTTSIVLCFEQLNGAATEASFELSEICIRKHRKQRIKSPSARHNLKVNWKCHSLRRLQTPKTRNYSCCIFFQFLIISVPILHVQVLFDILSIKHLLFLPLAFNAFTSLAPSPHIPTIGRLLSDCNCCTRR